VTRIRRLTRRFGITAPKVAVHTQSPWYLRWGLICAALGVVLCIAWFTYDAGRSLAGFQSREAAAEQERLSEEVVHLKDENTELRSQLAGIEHQMQIESATHGNLATQMKTLTDENALLKEDLAFFQTLMTTSGESPAGISINRFRVRPDALPGEYRYQLLVVQARTHSREFQGTLQLVVDLDQDGDAKVLLFPRDGEKGSPYNLSFKFYQRVEGVFQVPAGATVKRVQVRVLENGTTVPKSSQTVNLF